MQPWKGQIEGNYHFPWLTGHTLANAGRGVVGLPCHRHTLLPYVRFVAHWDPKPVFLQSSSLASQPWYVLLQGYSDPRVGLYLLFLNFPKFLSAVTSACCGPPRQQPSSPLCHCIPQPGAPQQDISPSLESRGELWISCELSIREYLLKSIFNVRYL